MPVTSLLAVTATTGTGPVLYGFTLGLVGAVNPCGFPLLPAYLLASASEAASLPLAYRAVRALWSGLLVTVGFLVVFAPLGAVAEAAGGLPLGWVPWVMIPVGVTLAVVGTLSAAGRLPYFHLPTPGLRRSRHRALALAGFGVSYAVASLTCSLPVFLAGVVGSFVRQGSGTGIPVSLAYALGMGLVITAVSVAGAGAQVVGLRRLRAWQPVIQRVAGGFIAVVGAYLVLYWVTDVAFPLSAPAPVRAVERLQSDVSVWLSASPRLTGIVIGGVVVAVLAAASVYGLRRPAAAEKP